MNKFTSLDKIQLIYDYINRSIMQFINYHPTIKYQLPITTKRGGLGMRPPNKHYTASKITALSNKVERVRKCFRFDEIKMDESERIRMDTNVELLQDDQIFYKSQQKQNDYVNQLQKQFQEEIEPDLIYDSKVHKKHGDLLKLIDLKCMQQHKQEATDKDLARINGIQINGAS